MKRVSGEGISRAYPSYELPGDGSLYDPPGFLPPVTDFGFRISCRHLPQIYIKRPSLLHQSSSCPGRVPNPVTHGQWPRLRYQVNWSLERKRKFQASLGWQCVRHRRQHLWSDAAITLTISGSGVHFRKTKYVGPKITPCGFCLWELYLGLYRHIRLLKTEPIAHM